MDMTSVIKFDLEPTDIGLLIMTRGDSDLTYVGDICVGSYDNDDYTFKPYEEFERYKKEIEEHLIDEVKKFIESRYKTKDIDCIINWRFSDKIDSHIYVDVERFVIGEAVCYVRSGGNGVKYKVEYSSKCRMGDSLAEV